MWTTCLALVVNGTNSSVISYFFHIKVLWNNILLHFISNDKKENTRDGCWEQSWGWLELHQRLLWLWIFCRSSIPLLVVFMDMSTTYLSYLIWVVWKRYCLKWVSVENAGWLPLCSKHSVLFVCYCLFGALTPTFAVWNITVTGDNMVLREQSGSHCCFFVPNPVLKTHRWKEVINETLVLALVFRNFAVVEVLPLSNTIIHPVRISNFWVFYRMVREDENTWGGTLGCRRIYVKRISEDELRHWTTDGWFTLTR